MATLQSIQAKIAKLQAEAEAITKKKSASVIAEIHSLMAEHGITIDDLGSAFGGKKRGTKMADRSASDKTASNAKYRDPKSGATWSGHGRAPGWIAGAKNRDKFLIDGSAAAAPTAGKASAKDVGNYVRGPQPALYRDPKSGATWSGRGRAPGWIADAKNRDRFLIDGSATTAPAVDKSAAKPVGNYVRGPQPAKYRDPKSGAEWSGRGKAPGWLAGARDRTKFLIDGAAAASADDNESVPKTVAAKKAGAKKTTATVPAKKGAAKKASATSAKTSAGKQSTAKKSKSVAKKGPQAGSKKTAAKKVVAKKAGGKAMPESTADSTTLLPETSGSEVDAVSSAG
ncbi:H-NS histone family protein [Caballeronia novacaledonica]|uniref:H-NS histone family protein n=1 Tax=Caballeronia novacaledonica TaxID=1544861 RepID=A0ACB5QR41_9BURK|nr:MULTISPECIES: H-NS family nucleoid-associated regulatory protein [Caballeronia]MDR5747819.1 H-NS family nucleoid-associated regulatory protein [Caballeronia sp. LZ029]GJH13681.1 H-NS histone family protein [Caballeronia novacaledonica]GJH17367.1 H-NS histone family protein [Caballeronia novacaledonica]